MSDLAGGGPLSIGYGRAANNGGTIAQSGPVPVGSPSSTAGIKGPSQIMRERNAREAQRKADQKAKEASEQRRAEEEQRLIDLENKRNPERRVGATGTPSRGGNIGMAPAPGLVEQMHRSEIRSGGNTVGKASGFVPLSASQTRIPGRSALAEETAGNLRPRDAPVDQSRQARHQEVHKASTTARPEPGPAGGQSDPTAQQQDTTSSSRKVTRSSFPHAFERWETLSAHWEGLTSYWVRRLEENSTDINKDPLSQQMSRQITDLSAAGANLFHAVVELQRLRASSERKFQRWFFETKEQEKELQRTNERLEKALHDERNNRSRAIEEAVSVAVAAEKEKPGSQKLMTEMRRELNIAREEARRAWEELGRREQDERDRTLSLRDGLPTLVGGVQVVPMMQGVTSRHSNARDKPPTGTDRPISGHYVSSQQANTEDPFAESSRPITSSTRPGNPSTSYTQYPNPSTSQTTSSSAPLYQQHQGPVLATGDPTGREQHNRSHNLSEPYSEEEYVIDSEGQYRRDSQGNKIRFPGGSASDIMEEYDDGEVAEHSRTAASAADYSGEGYGADWDAVRTAHHHPTRLSDVLEEDERSRTSASQLSRN